MGFVDWVIYCKPWKLRLYCFSCSTEVAGPCPERIIVFGGSVRSLFLIEA